ncbi:MAG: hypothetical protein ACRCZF_24065 [Gemmataceae bacterium]
MLTISDAQMKSFAAASVTDFVARLKQHLQSTLPKHGLHWAEGRIKSEIQAGLAESPRFFLETEAHIARWIELVCVYCDGFAQRLPVPFRNHLNDRRKSIPERLNQCEEWAKKRTGRGGGR